MEEKVRTAVFYKNYFLNFYSKQTKKVKAKIDWTIKLIEHHEFVPQEYFKHLTDTDGIWEIRVKLGSNNYRVLCFFDRDRLIILENGFQKKAQKTPKKEIKKAERIKKEYFDEKKSKS